MSEPVKALAIGLLVILAVILFFVLFMLFWKVVEAINKKQKEKLIKKIEEESKGDNK